MAKRKMLVDPACAELADHFLKDVNGYVTDEDRTEFAEAIQRICEDWCNVLAAEIQEGEMPDDPKLFDVVQALSQARRALEAAAKVRVGG